MKVKHILFLILSVSILSACIQTKIREHSKSVAKSWQITLLVTGNAGGASMKVNTPRMPGCGSSAADGCMYFGHNETAEITFGMSGNDAGWHITELKICKGFEPPAPIDEDCELLANAWDFYVMDSNGLPRIPDPLTGKINWKYSDSMKSFVLHNRNFLEQEYYYLAIACDGENSPRAATEPNCEVADPPMDNRGVK